MRHRSRPSGVGLAARLIARGRSAPFLLALAALLAALPAAAQGRRPQRDTTAARRAASDTGRASPADSLRERVKDIVARADQPPVVTHGSAKINGQVVRYTARTGMLPIHNDTGLVEGAMFYVYYAKDGADAATRPLTFAFNGGPGSSTVWLHMGAFGPKRVKLNPDGSAPPPPYAYEDNPYSLLDQTDIVFLDPVGTGYSRAAKPDYGPKFWGVDEDIRAVGEFIRLFLTRNERWGSPKFLAGESYGTTRAAGLSGYLVNNGIALNGIVLLSTVLDFQYLSDERGNDIAFIGFLPSFTATAWYHKKLPADLQRLPLDSVTRQAERWAKTDYALALLQGSALPANARKQIAEQLARYTGLSPQYVEQNDLRVTQQRFDHELLRDQQLLVGRLDSRFTAFQRDPAGDRDFLDPSEAAIRNSFTPVLNDYVRRILGYHDDDVYYILGGGLRGWKFLPQQEMGYTDVTPSLESAFVKNPHMRLYVAEGYYDLATPYFAVDHTLSHLDVAPEIRGNITVGRFAAGHMMYIDDPSMQKLRSDLRAFIDRATTK